MRICLVLLPLLMIAAPAAAQTPAPAPAIQVPPQLTDPAMADKLANVMQALSKAFLDLPVGEVEAAVEGRKPTAADRRRTVRDSGRIADPNFERDFRRQIENSKPMIQASLKALAEALPAMVQSMDAAGKALERAATNMPDPTYPKR